MAVVWSISKKERCSIIKLSMFLFVLHTKPCGLTGIVSYVWAYFLEAAILVPIAYQPVRLRDGY